MLKIQNISWFYEEWQWWYRSFGNDINIKILLKQIHFQKINERFSSRKCFKPQNTLYCVYQESHTRNSLQECPLFTICLLINRKHRWQSCVLQCYLDLTCEMQSRLNRILKRVILLSVLVIFSVPNNIFLIIFRSFCMTKCFKPSSPKESKKKMSCFGSISSMLHQCVLPFSELSVFAITKGYFPIFSGNHGSMINKFVHMIWWKKTQQNYHWCLHRLCFLRHFPFESYWFPWPFF